MQHYKTYKLRKQMLLNNLSGWWFNYVYIAGYSKLVFKRKWKYLPIAEPALHCL